MTDDRPSTQEQVAPFSATLTPHRSLGAQGFLVLMSVWGAVNLALGVAVVSIGAWPVFAFFGLDLALLYLAFRLSYRAGRLVETVAIEGPMLVLSRRHPSGAVERYEFPAYWARVHLEAAQDGRTRASLASHGRAVSFGAFLTDAERREVSAALSAALHKARGRGQTVSDRPVRPD